jgi:hypothetical protein
MIWIFGGKVRLVHIVNCTVATRAEVTVVWVASVRH